MVCIIYCFFIVYMLYSYNENIYYNTTNILYINKAIIWMEVTRLYSMYYRLSYLNVMDSDEWKNRINTQATKDNFFLKNRVSIYLIICTVSLYSSLHIYTMFN